MSQLAERTPERRFKDPTPVQLPNTCEDGGFDCIQLSVAKSKVWKLAMPD